MGDLRYDDREGIDRAIAAVRDVKSANDWATFGYKDNNSGTNTIVLEQTGSGGLGSLVASLKPDRIAYCLLRVIDVIDDHPTVKFVYVKWVGTQVKFMQKAKTTTHKGGVASFIGQSHVSLEVEKPEELSAELVMSKVQDASGSANRVLDSAGGRVAPSGSAASSSSASFQSGAKKAKPVNVPEDKAPLAAVRTDADPTDWALYSYDSDSGNTVVPVGQGSGGLDELKAHLKDNQVFYGLLRVSDMIDDRAHTKFVYIFYVGEGVKPTRKGLITTHKGTVTSFIGQHHVAVEPTALSELTMDDVMRRVRDASGTAVHVKDTVEKSDRVHLTGGI